MLQVCFNLDESELKFLRALAKLDDKHMGDLMRLAIQEYLEKREPDIEIALCRIAEEEQHILEQLFRKDDR